MSRIVDTAYTDHRWPTVRKMHRRETVQKSVPKWSIRPGSSIEGDFHVFFSILFFNIFCLLVLFILIPSKQIKYIRDIRFQLLFPFSAKTCRPLVVSYDQREEDPRYIGGWWRPLIISSTPKDVGLLRGGDIRSSKRHKGRAKYKYWLVFLLRLAVRRASWIIHWLPL